MKKLSPSENPFFKNNSMLCLKCIICTPKYMVLIKMYFLKKEKSLFKILSKKLMFT